MWEAECFSDITQLQQQNRSAPCEKPLAQAAQPQTWVKVVIHCPDLMVPVLADSTVGRSLLSAS